MRVTRLHLREFRSHDELDVELGPGLTVIHGANGAGKTNIVEGLYFGCTGRSCRTTNEREVVRFGAQATRVDVEIEDHGEAHTLGVGFQPGEPKRLLADGASVERLLDVPYRPLIGVFLPERLDLVKGGPGLRRAHVDRAVAGLWPARRATRRAYGQALAQRNALLLRVRGGSAARDSLLAWDRELAQWGVALRDDRAEALALLEGPFTDYATGLGLRGEPRLRYRARTKALDAAALATELAERTEADLARGFTGHGPHRDDVVFEHDGRDLRAYGSQGEQRLALLGLLLAERAALASTRTRPLLILDDVMSELDARRRELLATELRSGGQAIVTTTDLSHVPGSEDPEVARIGVSDGRVFAEASVA